MHLGLKEWSSDFSDVDRDNLERYNIQPFMRRYSPKNTRFFGIESDLHKTMKSFPYLLDLVFSDNTYFHLTVPWLALKRTFDRLNVGGVALVRTIDLPNKWFNDELKTKKFLSSLRDNNPSYKIFNAKSGHEILGVIKNDDKPFITNLYVGKLERENDYNILTVMSDDSNDNLLRLDDL